MFICTYGTCERPATLRAYGYPYCREHQMLVLHERRTRRAGLYLIGAALLVAGVASLLCRAGGPPPPPTLPAESGFYVYSADAGTYTRIDGEVRFVVSRKNDSAVAAIKANERVNGVFIEPVVGRMMLGFRTVLAPGGGE